MSQNPISETPRPESSAGQYANQGAPSSQSTQPQAAEPREPQPQLDPALDGRSKGGATGATWVALIIGLLLLVLLLVFVLQNMNDVLITYMAWEFTLPLGVAMLLAAVAGGLIMAMVGSIRLIMLKRRVNKLEKERETIKRTLR
ncbi:MAG: lipopolysaccharide assembly protein LapA domain-containing protein [Kocuria sp.]|nr:lipopolysaccharide assembly protein LapA domain-containing protein [Kocuria sp.]